MSVESSRSFSSGATSARTSSYARATPRPGRETWSYGSSLSTLLAERNAGSYVEMDLIVPELIQDGTAWRAMPWYDHYSDALAQGAALTMQLGPKNWVVFAPRAG